MLLPFAIILNFHINEDICLSETKYQIESEVDIGKITKDIIYKSFKDKNNKYSLIPFRKTNKNHSANNFVIEYEYYRYDANKFGNLWYLEKLDKEK